MIFIYFYFKYVTSEFYFLRIKLYFKKLLTVQRRIKSDMNFKLTVINMIKKLNDKGFSGGTVVKSLPANAEDMGSSPGPGGSHMSRSS